MNYGLPYMGSKNKIADWILENLPEAENFYDLFGGGGAITHAAILSEKYKNIYYNDIQKGLPQLFLDAVKGKYKDEARWISREDFNKLKDKDMFIKYCWSFGNNGKAYIYGKSIEEYKHGIHNAIFFQDYDILKNKYSIDFESNKETIKERKTEYNKYIKENKDRLHKIWKENGIKSKRLKSLERLQSLERLERLERLQSLERLERLQSLESLESLEISNKSYDEFNITGDAVIYCDIPYKNTASYTSGDFDYEKFYNWCEKQTVPVYISEYSMPEDRFEIVAEKTLKRKLSGVKNTVCNEKLFKVKKNN
jgi:site-specific DNA-adenine methylase